MMLQFHADAVSAEYNENGVLVNVFADLQERIEVNHYFLIQCTNEDDRQNIASNIDTYYIERDDQGYSTYGGIKKLSLSPHQINIELDELGQKKLEVSRITIGFALTNEKYIYLKQQLKKIFDEKRLSVEA
ncbi:Imm10 family immunity protein [Rhodocytophaga aerolata]|uniref:Imm10 family immunity protein n=1 Tax=Rhodocytophaga aerolata TaxID=455078 RepID=A0ABT8R451_9BACT|nr:Imm10 family immunity protein [Rhodocytophaga aerolata]MDO1446456.1 Imm10 family immunity protein [Rhodocytophaga aerolata]